MKNKLTFKKINSYIQLVLIGICAALIVVRYALAVYIHPTAYVILCSLIVVNALFRVAYNCKPKMPED